jgi:SAM-dependent methyltransferase
MGWLAILTALGLLLCTVACQLRLQGVPPTPTSPRVRRELLRWIPRDRALTVHDFGAGDGRLARAIARSAPRARVIGYERSPAVFLLARLLLLLDRRVGSRVELRFADFATAELQPGDLVLAYLNRKANQQLARLLARRAPSGLTVITHTFALRGWTPVATAVAPDLYRTRIFVYRLPESLPGAPEPATDPRPTGDP